MKLKETETVELKKSTGLLKQALISICAILNKHGQGELYFGVENNGRVVRQQVTESTLRQISQKISENIEPKIYPSIEKIILQNKPCIRIKFEGKERSYLRNPQIAEIFYFTKDIERWGSGLERIYNECSAKDIEVTFEILKTGFLVTFNRQEVIGEKEKTAQKTTQKTTRKILQLLKENPGLSRKEIAGILGNITEDGVKYHLAKLKKDGKIKRIGAARGGYWQVVENK